MAEPMLSINVPTTSTSLAEPQEANNLEIALRQRTAELELIGSVQQGLAARLGMEGIYDLVGDRIRDLFDAQTVVIRTFDREKSSEHWKYAIEKGTRQTVPPRALDGFSHHLMSLTGPLVVNSGFEGFIMQFSEETAVDGETPRSAVFVPLMADGLVQGNVSLQNVDREHAFSETDVRLLGTLANSMSVALENARLFDETTRLLAETEQRNAELAVINAVQEALVAEVDMQGIYDLVGDRIRDQFDAQVVGIATFDLSGDGTEELCYVFEDGQRYYPEPRPIDALRRKIIVRREIILVNENLDARLEELTGEDIPNVPGTESPKSAVYVPMMVGEAVRGYITLQNLDREHAFSASDVRLLATLTNSMTMALENARLFDETNRLLAETEQRNAELAVINSVQAGLVAELDMQGIYDLVGDRIREIFDAQVVVIRTFDADPPAEHVHYAFEKGERFFPEVRPADRFTEHLMRLTDPLVIDEDFSGFVRGFEDTDEATFGEVPKSAVFVPLTVGGEVRGNVSLQNVDREHAFSEADVRLLNTLANSMSVALENARLFDETHRLLAETEQRNAELAVINSVQEGLVAELDMTGIYDLVGDRIRDLFDAQVVAIATFDHEARTEDFRYLFEDGLRYYPEARPYNAVRQKLIDSRQLILINQDAPSAWLDLTGQPLDAVPGTRLAQSMLFVPLVVGEAVRGYVSLQNLDRQNAFSEADVRLLSTLANSMSVALENARLFDETNRLLAETEQRNAELAVINNVQEGLVAEVDIQGIYDLVGERIRELFDAQCVMIATFDHASRTECFEYLHEDGKRHYSDPRPYDAIRKLLIETRELILINKDADEVTLELTGKIREPVPGTRLPLSLMFVPLIVGDTVRGYVSLQNLDREQAFSSAEVRLLTTLANSMSVAIENARLFSETRQQATELDTVNRISGALVAQLDFDTLIHLVGEQMRETFGADIVYVALLNQDEKLIEFPYVYGESLDPLPLGEGLASQIIRSAKPLLINADVQGRTREMGIERVGKQSTSYLGVPVLVGSEAIGVISVQSTHEEDVFDEGDLRLLSTIAANVGIALQNARSYQQLNAALSELKRTQAQLVQQEKLASLGALTAGIAHEIKNPLNFINNFGQLIGELSQELVEELQPYSQALDAVKDVLADLSTNASKITEHGRRADSIVRSMLLHSRHGTGTREMVDINALVEEYANLAYHGKRAQSPSFNVEIKRDLDSTMGEIEAVPQDLGRVILNLLGNAFDAVMEYAATANGSADAPYQPSVSISTRRASNHVSIRVADNGPGIPEHVRVRIFEPFFTTKPAGKGTGLGLSMSHEIITQGHAGTLNVGSSGDRGTTFTITLPITHSSEHP